MSGDRGHGGASGFPRPGKGAGVGAAAKGGNRRGTNGWGRGGGCGGMPAEGGFCPLPPNAATFFPNPLPRFPLCPLAAAKRPSARSSCSTEGARGMAAPVDGTWCEISISSGCKGHGLPWRVRRNPWVSTGLREFGGRAEPVEGAASCVGGVNPVSEATDCFRGGSRRRICLSKKDDQGAFPPGRSSICGKLLRPLRPRAVGRAMGIVCRTVHRARLKGKPSRSWINRMAPLVRKGPVSQGIDSIPTACSIRWIGRTSVFRRWKAGVPCAASRLQTTSYPWSSTAFFI